MNDLSFTLYERLENNESKFVGRYYNGYSEKQVIDIVCNRTKAFDKGRMLYVVLEVGKATIWFYHRYQMKFHSDSHPSIY